MTAAGLHGISELAGIPSGPVFRLVSKGNWALGCRLHPEAANDLVQAVVARAGIKPWPLLGPFHPCRVRQLRTWAKRHNEERRRLLTMGFRTFLRVFIDIPCQIVKKARRVVWQPLGWTDAPTVSPSQP